jgi:hypothetical protein
VPEWNVRLKNVAIAFVLLVILQCFASFAYTGSIVLAGIGFMAYLSPFPALQMSYSFAVHSKRIYSFLGLYLALNFVMATGIYLSLLGFDWAILRTVGDELMVYSIAEGARALPSGFYRVPEVAAWHCASGACLALAIGLSNRRQTILWFCAALALFFFGAVLLTGRRKFLVEIAIFLPIVLMLFYKFKLGSAKYLSGVLVATVIGVGLAASGIATDDTVSSFRGANLRGQERGETVQGELFDRVYLMTIETFPYIVERNGIFGSGAGSGSQGAQYFGGGDELVGAAAEGGLGKILAEVGIPGLLIFIWLGIKIISYVWKTLDQVSKGDPSIARLTMGLAAFLAANGMVFVTAHQVYGDLFVLLIIGFVLGFIFAIRRLTQPKRPSVDGPGQNFGSPRSYNYSGLS